MTKFGVGPSLFLELSLAGLADRLLHLEIDAHICIKTRIKIALMKWILVIPVVGKSVPLPLLDPLIRPSLLQQRRSRLAPTEVLTFFPVIEFLALKNLLQQLLDM